MCVCVHFQALSDKGLLRDDPRLKGMFQVSGMQLLPVLLGQEMRPTKPQHTHTRAIAHGHRPRPSSTAIAHDPHHQACHFLFFSACNTTGVGRGRRWACFAGQPGRNRASWGQDCHRCTVVKGVPLVNMLAGACLRFVAYAWQLTTVFWSAWQHNLKRVCSDLFRPIPSYLLNVREWRSLCPHQIIIPDFAAFKDIITRYCFAIACMCMPSQICTLACIFLNCQAIWTTTGKYLPHLRVGGVGRVVSGVYSSRLFW